MVAMPTEVQLVFKEYPQLFLFVARKLLDDEGRSHLPTNKHRKPIERRSDAPVLIAVINPNESCFGIRSTYQWMEIMKIPAPN